MRRFSQRNSLVTLSDINITPLLDLAFVLLIIFIIISPSIRSSREQGMDLNLPKSDASNRSVEAKDVRTVSIDPRGAFELDGRRATLDIIERQLVQAHRANPDLVVYIRADQDGLVKHFSEVINRCQRNGIMNFSLRTEPNAR